VPIRWKQGRKLLYFCGTRVGFDFYGLDNFVSDSDGDEEGRKYLFFVAREFFYSLDNVGSDSNGDEEGRIHFTFVAREFFYSLDHAGSDTDGLEEECSYIVI
jgi:hypothetical protein